MKKILFTAVVALVMAAGMSSCSKCRVCTKASEPEVRYCEKDYGSKTEYGFAIDSKEAQGFSCKSSL